MEHCECVTSACPNPEERRPRCGVSMATAGRTPLCRHLHALCIQFHTLLYLGIYKQCKSPFCSLLIVHSLAVNKPPLERSWLYLALQHKDSVGKCCVVSYSQIYLKSSSFLVRRKIWRDSLFINPLDEQSPCIAGILTYNQGFGSWGLKTHLFKGDLRYKTR